FTADTLSAWPTNMRLAISSAAPSDEPRPRPAAAAHERSADVAQHLGGVLRQLRQLAARGDDADMRREVRPHDRIGDQLTASEFFLHGGIGEDGVAEAAFDHRLGEGDA